MKRRLLLPLMLLALALSLTAWSPCWISWSALLSQAVMIFMSCAISRTADMAMPIAMHTQDLPWAISISICMGCRTTVLTLSWYV